MSQSNISPLRQRMIDDMSLRKLSAPDSASAEDLRLFQKHLVDQGVSSVTINATITGLRFFFDMNRSGFTGGSNS
jgi:integrase/recombinase XerD